MITNAPLPHACTSSKRVQSRYRAYGHTSSNTGRVRNETSPPKPFGERSLDDRETSKLDRDKGKSKRAWLDNLYGSEDRKPWESEYSRQDKPKDRGRSSSPSGDGGGGKDGKNWVQLE